MVSKNIKILIGVVVGVLIATGISLGIYFGVKSENDTKSRNSGGGYRKVGYFQQTATNFNCTGIKPMTADKIPVEYYNHVIYGFAPKINQETFQFQDAGGTEEYRYRLLNDHKNSNPNLKTLISVGGDLVSNLELSTAVKDENRAKFVSGCISFAKKFNFDGIDIDWEYPTQLEKQGSPEDDVNFVKFIKELRQEINKQNPKLLLSCALPGGPFWGQHYHVPEIINDVDFFNIMAYNVQGPWGNKTACSSPLESANPESQDSVKNSVEFFTNNFQLDTRKFNLGISYFGISYKLKDSNNKGMNAPISSEPGVQGFCSKQDGYLAYFEIQRLNNNVEVITDKKAVCKYFVSNNTDWIAYDDPDTFKTKIDYLKEKRLGGISVWGMDSDSLDNLELTKFVNNNL